MCEISGGFKCIEGTENRNLLFGSVIPVDFACALNKRRLIIGSFALVSKLTARLG